MYEVERRERGKSEAAKSCRTIKGLRDKRREMNFSERYQRFTTLSIRQIPFLFVAAAGDPNISTEKADFLRLKATALPPKGSSVVCYRPEYGVNTPININFD